MLATAKVPNLKANHNADTLLPPVDLAVLATAKVPNLKANHNKRTTLSSLSMGASPLQRRSWRRSSLRTMTS